MKDGNRFGLLELKTTECVRDDRQTDIIVPEHGRHAWMSFGVRRSLAVFAVRIPNVETAIASHGDVHICGGVADLLSRLKPPSAGSLGMHFVLFLLLSIRCMSIYD
jgi:hypothetical protein